MRVKFGNHIDLCKRVSYSGGTILVITTTYNSIYSVECGNKSIASKMYEQALVDGCLDVSEFEYSNC